MSYAQLIAEALINSEEGVLTLSEIYQVRLALQKDVLFHEK